MFNKINYIMIIILTALLGFIAYSGGKANWKDAQGKDFYAMSARSKVSDKEKEERIRKTYSKVMELIDSGALEKALLMLKQMETGNKNDAHLYFLQGEIYSKMKLYKESITSFLKAVKLDPDYVEEGCSLYRGTLIKEVTQDAIEYFKDRSDSASRETIKIVYAMQRRLAGSCE